MELDFCLSEMRWPGASYQQDHGVLVALAMTRNYKVYPNSKSFQSLRLWLARVLRSLEEMVEWTYAREPMNF